MMFYSSVSDYVKKTGDQLTFLFANEPIAYPRYFNNGKRMKKTYEKKEKVVGGSKV